MALTKHKLGDLMVPFSKACGIPNLDENQVSGINREKEFFEPSRQVGADTTKYQIVPQKHFACNLMHVGRDKVLPIAYNHSNKEKIVSPAYSVFSLKKDCGVLDDYFFLMLKSDERDRFFWFQTDSSIRDGMSWEDFCNVKIIVPDVPTQQKYVDVYNAMVANQQSYERGLDDLKIVCDSTIEDFKKKYPVETFGKYITRVDERNVGNKYKNVKNVSVTKEFSEVSAKVNKNELSGYKIVKPRQITFVQTTHNEHVFCNALNNTDEVILVTSVNEVFECNEQYLIPEYLCINFNRAEFDRYARFHSWGSARETFTWTDLQEVKIPMPPTDVQKALADLFTVYRERKQTNLKLKAQIKDICPILIKGSLEEARKEA